MISPRPLSPVLLFGLVPVASWFIVRPFLEPVPSIPALYSSLGFSIFAFLATLHLVPALGPTFIKANLKGKDLLKTYQTPMSVYRDRSNKGYHFWCLRRPESIGLVCASIYVLSLILFIPFAFSTPIHEQAALKKSHEGITVVEFPHHQVSVFFFQATNILDHGWIFPNSCLYIYLHCCPY